MLEKNNQKKSEKRTYNEMKKNAIKLKIINIKSYKEKLNEKENKQYLSSNEKPINLNIFKKQLKTNIELSKNTKTTDEKNSLFNSILNIDKNIDKNKMSHEEIKETKIEDIKDIESLTKKINETFISRTNDNNNIINNHTSDESETTEIQTNEILIKIKINQNELNKNIYFLDNTDGKYKENKRLVKHNHDNLSEINQNNTSLFINEKKLIFKKYFIPTKIKTYSIKLIFKNKLSNCAYMFCNCSNIIDINFSKFKFHNIISMLNMFRGCSSLTTLNLSSFNTENVTDMGDMFRECSSLTNLNLSSFNTKNVTNMMYMFFKCSSLTTLNLSSFNTKNVTNMRSMFSGCTSLIKLNLSSFNTQNVTKMTFMFYQCINLSSCGSSDKNIEYVFKKFRV